MNHRPLELDSVTVDTELSTPPRSLCREIRFPLHRTPTLNPYPHQSSILMTNKAQKVCAEQRQLRPPPTTINLEVPQLSNIVANLIDETHSNTGIAASSYNEPFALDPNEIYYLCPGSTCVSDIITLPPHYCNSLLVQCRHPCGLKLTFQQGPLVSIPWSEITRLLFGDLHHSSDHCYLYRHRILRYDRRVTSRVHRPLQIPLVNTMAVV